MLKFAKLKRKHRNKESARLDQWFSRYIRIRDTDRDGLCKCITCSTRLPPAQMDCGHFVTRDNWNIRFHEWNAHGQCPNCNRFHNGNQARYALELDYKLGQGTAKMLLDMGARTGMLKGWEAGLQAEEYKKKVNDLLKEKGVAKWW